MGNLKGLYAEALRGNDLVVTQPHARWLATPEEEQRYSDRAKEHVQKAMSGDFKHPRPGRFSPSSMGKCHRRVMFDYAGAPQHPAKPAMMEMADAGSWSHMKWQSEGLTTGWAKDAEVWVYDSDLRCGGSADAVLTDDSLFELKTANTYVYRRIVDINAWPKSENLLQVAVYLLLLDLQWSSVVYEDRSSGQFHEFRVPRDAARETEALRRLKLYRMYAEDDELPQVLDECKGEGGTTFLGCPYRDICIKSVSVSEHGKVSQ